MERPDIVFINCHDLGRRLGLYGESGARTPSLERLAAGGIVLERAFSTSTMCSPSRGSIATGRYPHEIGLQGLTNRGWDLRAGERALPLFLSEAGYHTVLFGLQHEARGTDRLGYRERVALPSPHPAPVREVADQVAERIRSLPPRGERPPAYINVGIFEPHRHDFWERYRPLDAGRVRVPGYLPDTPGVRQDLARYDGLVEAMDSGVGTILDALDAAGMSGNTLVLFTTDHGIAFPRAKTTVYDAGIGVTALARWPGRIAPGGRSDALVSHVDWLPTLLEALGIEIPEEVRGQSFLPVLLGRGPGPRGEIFAEATYHIRYNPVRCVRTERFKLIRNYDSAPEVSADTSQDPRNGILAREDYPEHFWQPAPPLELFDLAADPCEQNNLADDPEFAAVRRELLKKLDDWQLETADPLRRLYATHEDVREN